MSKLIPSAGGLIACLLGASLWGVSGTCAQYLFEHTAITPLTLTSTRMVSAGVLFLVSALVFDRAHLLKLLRAPRYLWGTVLFGVVGLLGSQITYVIVIQLTNAGTATVLQSSGSALLLGYACIAVRRYPRLIEVLSLLLAVISVWIIATQGSFDSLSLPLAGVLWGLLNGCAVAWYLWFPQKLFNALGSFCVTGLGMFAGGLVTGLATTVYAWVDPAFVNATPLAVLSLEWSLDTVLVAFFFVVVGTFASFALYLYGSSRIGAVFAGMIGALEPASATVVSALWLGVALSVYDVIGLVLMMVVTVLVSYASSTRSPKSTSAVHS